MYLIKLNINITYKSNPMYYRGILYSKNFELVNPYTFTYSIYPYMVFWETTYLVEGDSTVKTKSMK